MKKFIPLLLALCLMLCACTQQPAKPEAQTPSEPPSSEPENAALPSQQELEALLRDSEQLEAHPLAVFPSDSGMENTEVVGDFIEHVKNGENAYFVGIAPTGAVPTSFAVSYDADAKTCTYLSFFRTNKKEEKSRREITQLSDCELFWNFSDGKEISLSIPKTGITYAEKKELSDYVPGEDLGTVTAADAVKSVQKIVPAVGGALFGSLFGIVYDLPASPLYLEQEPEIVGGYEILGERYYKVLVHHSFEDYYMVSAQTPDRLLYIEEVNGSLVPVALRAPVTPKA